MQYNHYEEEMINNFFFLVKGEDQKLNQNIPMQF